MTTRSAMKSYRYAAILIVLCLSCCRSNQRSSSATASKLGNSQSEAGEGAENTKVCNKPIVTAINHIESPNGRAAGALEEGGREQADLKEIIALIQYTKRLPPQSAEASPRGLSWKCTVIEMDGNSAKIQLHITMETSISTSRFFCSKKNGSWIIDVEKPGMTVDLVHGTE